MISLSSVLGALSADASLLEKIVYQVNGLMIVFIALGSIWLLMEISGALFRKRDARIAKAKADAAAAKVDASPARAGASAKPEEGAMTPQLAAVVAAAVHTTLAGRQHRIVSVVKHLPPDLSWASEGRRDHFASRSVR